MQTRKFDLAQTDGWVSITEEATQALVQLRTEGNVELYIGPAEFTPSVDPLQGALLSSKDITVFSVTGMQTTDAIFVRTLGKSSDTDTIIVMDDGLAGIGPA